MSSPDDIAIRVQNVSKTFKLPHERSSSIKSLFVNFARRKKSYELQKALSNVSFEVKKGEFFGIVGRNGSGKSTLLKLLAGIYTPTAGDIQVNGKLTPFIELGVGFNPELTGRENVFLNGALLGFNHKEMQEMYDDIVDFAELERFMDQKLKNYSSGMQVRLAFSIAIRARTDILLIDEVLAVGDTAFQRKCLDVFEAYKAAGRTVILVTHDMGVVRQFCTKALHIYNGKVTSIGEPYMIAEEYRALNEEMSDQALQDQNERTSAKLMSKVSIKGKAGQALLSGDEITVTVDFSKIADQVGGVGVAIFRNSGDYVFGANTFRDKVALPKNGKLEYKAKLDIGMGTYVVKVGLFGDTEEKVVEFIDEGPKFRVRSEDQKWEGIVNLKHEWKS